MRYTSIFGKNLATLRTRKGWTIKATADYLGLKTSTYSSYEQGRSEPSIKMLIAISDLFQVRDLLLLFRVDISNQDQVKRNASYLAALSGFHSIAAFLESAKQMANDKN